MESGVVQVLECDTSFPFFPFRCPLVSLSYIPRAASAAFPYGGVLAGTLENASFWELKMGFSHCPHVLPIEPGGCVDFQTESSTRHCLVTYRPGECWDVLVLFGSKSVQGRRGELALPFGWHRRGPRRLTALATRLRLVAPHSSIDAASTPRLCDRANSARYSLERVSPFRSPCDLVME